MARYQVEDYVSKDGKDHFRRWLKGLDKGVQFRVQARVQRFEEGNLGKNRHLGSGLHEAILDLGPGYRLYFGLHEDRLILLLCGGSKSKQQGDIDFARECWREFREED